MSSSTARLLSSNPLALNYSSFSTSTPAEIAVEIASNDAQKGDAKNEPKKQSIKGTVIVYIWDSRCGICSCLSDCCCSSNKRIGHVSMQLLSSRYQPIDRGYISIWPGYYECYVAPNLSDIQPENFYNNTMVMVGDGNKRTVYFIEDNQFAQNAGQLITTEFHLSTKEEKAIGEQIGHIENTLLIKQLIKRAATQAKHSLREANYSSDLNHDKRKENGMEPVVRYLIKDVDVGSIFYDFERKRNKKKWAETGGGLFKEKDETHCSGLVLGLLYQHGGLKNLLRPSNEGCLTPSGIVYGNANDILEITREVLEEKPSSSNKTCRVLKTGGYYLLALFFLLTGALTATAYVTGVLTAAHYSERGNIGKGFIIACFVLTGLSAIAKLYFDLAQEHDQTGVSHAVAALRLCKKGWSTISNCGGITPDDVNFLFDYFSNVDRLKIVKVTYEGLKKRGYDVKNIISMNELHACDSDDELVVVIRSKNAKK